MKCAGCGIERKETDAPCSVCGAVPTKPEPVKAEPVVAVEVLPSAKIKGNGGGCLGAMFMIPGVLLLIGAFVFPFFGFFSSLLMGGLLIVVGGVLSNSPRCSNCGNKVDGKMVKMCPVCKVNFE